MLLGQIMELKGSQLEVGLIMEIEEPEASKIFYLSWKKHKKYPLGTMQ